MRNWIRDKFGANRVKTVLPQEQRLAPPMPASSQLNTLHGIPAAEWVNDGTYGTYANITRSSTVTWSSTIPTSSGYYWLAWDEPVKPVYPPCIQVPEGL